MNIHQHHYELDILRICGAIGIVLFHYTFRGYAADNMTIVNFPMLGSLFKYGYTGLYLFFILTGYTISLSIQRKKFSNFLLGRIVRLYPSYWAAVSLTAIVTFFLGGGRYHISIKQFLFNLTMLNSYFGVESVDGVYWFMYVIFKFYFLISMVLIFNMARYLKYFAGLWLISSAAIIYYNIPKIGFFLIPEYSPFLIAGIIFSSAKKEGWDSYKLIITSFSMWFSLYLGNVDAHNMTQHYHAYFSQLVVAALIGVTFLCMFLVTVNKNNLKMNKVIPVLGACTYPLYLIHQHIGFMIFNNFIGMFNKYLLLAVTMSAMTATAILIIKHIDPFVFNLMNKIIKVEKRPGLA